MKFDPAAVRSCLKSFDLSTLFRGHRDAISFAGYYACLICELQKDGRVFDGKRGGDRWGMEFDNLKGIQLTD
jgi:hypothetical protein